MKLHKPNLISMGTGTPVILLHSALSSKLQWYKLMKSLSVDYQVIALDLTGYGDSPFPTKTENFRLSDEVEFVQSLISEIIPQDIPIHVVGHSFGAAVSVHFALEAINPLRSLTVFEPVLFNVLPHDETAYELSKQMNEYIHQQVMEGKVEEAAKRFMDRWGGKGTFMSFPEEYRKILCKGMHKLHLDFYSLTEETSTMERYKEIKIPVCFIAGKQSPIESRFITEIMASQLPNARLIWVETGHMSPVLHPEVINPIIESFIREIDRNS